MKQQQGFTLIELIVVIVILGILAATALPKYSSLAGDARLAKMNGLLGALKSGVAITHGVALVKGTPAGSAVLMEDGTSIAMSGYYPDAVISGIPLTIGMSGVGDYVSIVAAGTSISFFPDQNHANTGTCGISYVPASQSTVVGFWAAASFVATGISNVAACM